MANIQFPWKQDAADGLFEDLTVLPNGMMVGSSGRAVFIRGGLTGQWVRSSHPMEPRTVKRFTALADGTIIGISSDGAIMKRGGPGGVWVWGYNLQTTLVSLGLCKDGSVIYVTPDGLLLGSNNSTTPRVAVPNSGGVIYATQLSDGTFLGIGPDNLVYSWDSLAGKWVQIPGSGPMISVVGLYPDTLLGLGTDKRLYYTSMTQAQPVPTKPMPAYHAKKLTILSQQFQEVGSNIYFGATYEVQFSDTEVRLDVGHTLTIEVEIPSDIAALLQVSTRRVRRVVGFVTPAGQRTRQLSFEVPIAKDELINPLHSTRVFNDGRVSLAMQLRLISDLQSGDATVIQPVALESTALSFNGTDTYLEVNGPLPVTTQLTVEMWMRGQPKDAFLFYFTDAGRRRKFSAHVPYVDGNVYFDAGADQNNNYDRIVKAVSPPDDWKTWNHWAFVRDTDQGRMSIYRNGALWHQATGLTRPMSDCDRLVLGADGDGHSLHAGMLSEVRVWSVARTAAQIVENMNIRIAGTSAGLIASYALDAFQAGQPIVDRSGAGRNGTLRGTTTVVAGPSFLSR